MKTVASRPRDSHNHRWCELLRSVYRMDKLCQFFGFLPKNVIDAHAEQYHLDRYAKKIYFRHFIELAASPSSGKKGDTTRTPIHDQKQESEKVHRHGTSRPLQPVRLHKQLGHRSPRQAHKNAGGEIRKPADEKGEKTIQNIRHHVDDCDPRTVPPSRTQRWRRKKRHPNGA